MDIKIITHGKPDDEWGRDCQKACDDLAIKGKSSVILSTEEISPGRTQGKVAMTLLGMKNPTLIYGLAHALVYSAKQDPKLSELLQCIIEVAEKEFNEKEKIS